MSELSRHGGYPSRSYSRSRPHDHYSSYPPSSGASSHRSRRPRHAEEEEDDDGYYDYGDGVVARRAPRHVLPPRVPSPPLSDVDEEYQFGDREPPRRRGPARKKKDASVVLAVGLAIVSMLLCFAGMETRKRLRTEREREEADGRDASWDGEKPYR